MKANPKQGRTDMIRILKPIRKHGRLVAGLALLLIANPLGAEENGVPKLFESDEVLAVTITAPWEELVRKPDYQDPYPATMTYTDSLGKEWSHSLTVERRGVKRQQTCDFPPIRLRFEKDEVRNSPFRGQDSLKMVTHCKKPEAYDQFYIIEMLAYRMYNVLSDYSFRVRPLSVRYMDDKGGHNVENRFAFVIEDDGDVAKRNGLKKLEIPYIRSNRLDASATADFALFQFLIGNTDWSAMRGPDSGECCHNAKLIAPRPFEFDDVAIPLPYDFDSTGIVNPPYAAPAEGLGINSVTQRVYRGYCAHTDALPGARQKLLDRKAEILAVLDSEDRLDNRSKKSTLRYVERFYKIIESDRNFERMVVKKCRN
jgi:hypothetical protein